MAYPEITTNELKELLNTDGVRIIDSRPIDAYNGWKLNGEVRGGHIKSAKTLPAKWTKYMDWIEIVDSKSISKEERIIIYGYDENQISQVAEAFNRNDFNNIYIYSHFLDEWVKDGSLPMDKLPRYKNLVYAEWVKDIVDGKIPPEHDAGKTVICHAHYRNRDAYLSGHIPGAIDIDTLALESPETWNRRSPGELKIALEAHGITSVTKVIMYGKFMYPDNADEFPGSAAGDIGAIRCAAIMMYAGVKDVRVLNGGFQSWEDAGFEIDHNDVPKNSVEDFGVSIPQHPELFVDTPEAKEILESTEAELVSVRSWPEFIGKVSGYNYIEKKGRIPGAVLANCGSDAYHMENYRNLDHTTREFHEIEQNWKDVDLTSDKHLAFYCGTGWRGSEAFFNAWLMGYPKVSVYDGGWFEWSNDPNNPYETGIPFNIERYREIIDIYER